MIVSDSSSRAMRWPAVPNSIPAASYSGLYQPAPIPSSNRPPEIRCRLAASCATIAGCRKSFDSTRVPTRSRVVTAAAAARPLNGASCCPNAAAEKWSRSSSVPIPPSSARRAKSSQSLPSRTDSRTIPNLNFAMARTLPGLRSKSDGLTEQQHGALPRLVFGVEDEHAVDGARHPVDPLGAVVFQRQAVLFDPAQSGGQVRDHLLRACDPDPPA